MLIFPSRMSWGFSQCKASARLWGDFWFCITLNHGFGKWMEIENCMKLRMGWDKVAGSVRAVVGKGEGLKQVRTKFHIRFRSKS